MQQKKMAAPCGRMASRPLLQFLSRFSRSPVGNTGFRQFSSATVCRAAFQINEAAERANSPWTLMAAVCLQRLPVISADCSPIEQQFKQMLHQVSLRIVEGPKTMSEKNKLFLFFLAFTKYMRSFEKKTQMLVLGRNI